LAIIKQVACKLGNTVGTFSTLIKAFTSNLTMTTELVDAAVLVSVSGATGLLMGPALLVFGSDSDVPVFLSKTYF